jgi:amino acid adenylation domain-containing protein/non-ribosomal peptide synthase protein (TIGR01720 family)
MSNIHQQIADLPTEKRELLARLLRQKGVQLERSVILPQPRDTSHFPLSFAQQRLWFLDQFTPGNPAYNLPSAVRLKGKLDLAALERSLNELAHRHESLRTSFVVINNQPAQVIAPELTLALRVTDLRELPAAEREAEARRLLVAEARAPFDLAEAPLLRASLFRLSDDDHALMLVLHHIISDGWSNGIFIREAITLYQAIARGFAPQLPPLPIQYADYAVWQRDWLSGEVHDRQLNYWLDKLRDCPTVLELPTDKPRPASLTSRGATVQFALPKELKRELTTLSQAHGATLFMTLLAAFQTLLHRYSGQDSISVGTPIANRMRPEVQNVIGFFVNTLVMNTDLSGDLTFTELLARVRETALGAYAHQDLPFEQLVEALQPARDASRTPLFQVMFSLEQVAPQQAETGAQIVEPLKLESSLAKFDLTLTLGESADELKGQIEYNTDLFEPETIRRMIGHFKMLLAGIGARPEEKVSRLPLLTEAEQQQLIAWNQTATGYPREASIQQLFEAQAARTPEAVAIEFQGQTLTYRELNARASQLAHHLRQLGVGRETLVGICAERSLEMIIGLLGILKAGAAYVPFDPAYPQERLAFMLADTNVPVLLTQASLKAAFPNLPSAIQTICLDAEWEQIAQQRADNPEDQTKPDDAAYVIYTSGSTGRPKGAVIPHRGVVRLVKETNYVSLSPTEVMLQFAPVSFDASTFEIWGALLSGARLIIFPPQTPTLEELGAFIRAHQITTLWLTASLFHLMADHQPDSLRGVRQLLAGGDVLSPAHVERMARVLEQGRVINGYGPTENTTFTCCYPAPQDYRAGGPLPIGRPIANTQVWILDRQCQPVPVGVPGELYIGGDGLARGYLNRPKLTAEKFIEWPMADYLSSSSAIGHRPSAIRLYRSGDLARFLPDGSIEFLGRLDQQVKIRGFRIEPGEIEATLTAHPSVREALVIAREDEPGDKRLVAYLISQAETSASQLREYLKERLPEYMLPSAFVRLEAFPLSPNGKVERKALPAPDGSQGASEGSAPPRSALEELLAGMWRELLRVERVGIYDNFFELGGHSLLATQLAARIREVFGIELPLRAVFEAATIAGLAARLEAARQAAPTSSAPPIRRIPRDGELPLSFAQQRLWFLSQLEPDGHSYNIPTAVRLHGQLNVAALEDCLSEIIRRHESLRTVFAAPDGRAVQVIAEEADFTLPQTDLRHLPEAEREAEARRMAEAEFKRGFDLARGPLLRCRLLRLADEDHILVMVMHHIISDGWSNSVLISEVGALYQAFSCGHPAPLPELAVQYADYAAWQREWLQGATLREQLSFWREQLGGHPLELALPTDHPRPAVQTFTGANHTFCLPDHLAAAVRQLSQQEGSTLFMTLLAAFQALLYRYTGQESINVGTPIANRTRAEVEGLIGFFVNTLVLRGDFSGEPDFRETLRRVRETALGAYAHQDLPFEMLVDHLQPERDLSRPPVFQVMFLFQEKPREVLQLPGLTLQPLEYDAAVAKFDLTLAVADQPDGLKATFEYNTDLFDAATIERMTGHFLTLLEALTAQPEEKISRLPLLTASELQRLLTDWNQTALPAPRGLAIPQLFEAQVKKTPDAVALVYDRHSLSFAEFNARANRLAHLLRAHGVGPDHLVGLFLERSLEMITGLFGILKAGGAYVPLDPTYPPERLAMVLEEAQPPVILTQKHLRDRLPEQAARIICLDSETALLNEQPDENPAPAGSDSHLAYVIFTSGSTGRPKGVMIEHRAALNLAAGLSHYIYGDKHARQLRVSLNAPLMFDASVQQWLMLLYGHTLDIIPQEIRLDGEALITFLGEHRIDVLDCVPSQLRLLLEAGLTSAAWKPSLVLPGGEAIDAAMWQHLAEADGIEFFNVYGPTECTVDSTTCCVSRFPHKPSIGRPLANVQLYILDQQQQPVPIGVPGELCIGGDGLARGYLNQPELTAEKFIAWQSAVGSRQSAEGNSEFRIPNSEFRLYRTGDLVRWLPDGHIEFLGRTDQQVKIRGFRIEPGDIETALAQHPAVRESVVVVREDEPGSKRLVAYLVAAQSELPGLTELREHLKAKLPEYMVPSAFVWLDKLPLTANGKLDRRALPAPETDRAELESEYVAPHTAAEEKLAAIWQQILGVKQIGVNDNFFALGGDSILSIQVIARARQAGLSLTPKQLFEHPTISGLAAVAGTAAVIEAEQGLVEGAAPLTPIQRWFFAQHLPDPAHWNQAAMLTLRQPLAQPLFEATLAELCTHHDALRMRYEHTPAGWTQTNAGMNGGETAAALWLDLSDRSDEQLRAEIETVAERLQSSLHLGVGPLLRAAYFDCGPQRPGRLLLVIHHLVVDGVSWRVLLEDFQTAYQQLSSGKSVQLPPKTTSFREWAERLEEYAQSDQARAELDYWLAATGGRVARLLVDEAEGINTEASLDYVTVELSESQTRSLLHEAPQAYRTEINDLLLAALAQTLTSWTREQSVLVDLEGHGREEIIERTDVSRTVGWFTTIYPVRLEAAPDWNAGELLRETRDRLRRIPQRGLGYGLLRYLSRDESVRLQLAAQPRAEVSFNYLGQFDQIVRTDGLFGPAPESTGHSRSLRGQRNWLLDVTGSVAGGQLRMSFSYSRQTHQRATIERVAADYLSSLQALIAHCLDPAAGSYMASDFELAGLDQKKLDKVLGRLSRGKKK